MLPIYKEYIEFLNNKTNNKLNFLEEGKYWYDKSIIKAFDLNGNVVKIARLNIDDKLNMNIKLYDKQIPMLEMWSDTVNRHKEELEQIEKESRELIMDSINKYGDRNISVLSSGGKDSTVTTFLVRTCISNPEIIFNNTSLDCADTYLHIKKENNLTIINPKEGFYQWRKRLNFIPTRFARACCNIFKEGAMVDYLDKDSQYLFFMGMRNQESAGRSGYGDEWKNHKWEGKDWDAILPIRKWSELQIWLYIIQNNIDINPKYKKGYSRVGCAIACPYYTKSTWILDEYWYPKLTNRWRNILKEDFKDNNKDLIMNCTEEEYLTCWNGGILRPEPTYEVVEQFANRNGLDVEVAKNYFGHKCKECNKKIKHKDVVGMNMKFNGRNIDDMYCKKHFKEKLDIDNQTWDIYIKRFRNQGCELF
ncbi:MAG: phosphoadenosine phosphosulfate reductase family protein [Cetobacterium sp.]